jgi:hypothetical protein
VGRQGGGGNHACAELQKLQGIVMLKYWLIIRYFDPLRLEAFKANDV